LGSLGSELWTHYIVAVQVKKHHDKMQAEKEAAGIAKLQADLPKLSRAVLAYALQDCVTDAEKALLMLRQFQSDTFDELAEIQRKRRALKSRQQRASSSDSSGTPEVRSVTIARFYHYDSFQEHKGVIMIA
jgi:hypothetical protein